MQIERIDWPDAIREKVERRHGLAIEEVESSLFDRFAHVRKAGRDRYALLGRSGSGAYITVIFAYQRQVARIITARKMDSKGTQTISTKKEVAMPKLPKFKTLEEESEYWDTHSVADHWDELDAVDSPLVDARPPKKLVSIRFDTAHIDATKRIARTKGIGYQTLLRMWAYDGLERELRRRRRAAPRKRGAATGK